MVKEQVFLVTGAAGGIGEALCRQLLDLGKTVIGTDIDSARLDALRENINNKNFSVDVLDVADADRFEKVCQIAVNEHGSLDCIINNAGFYATAPFLESEPGLWKKMIDVNLMGVVNGSRSGLAIMRQQGHGRIVNIASVAGKTPDLNSTVYVATKHAVTGLTATLRAETIHEKNIHVHTVYPGYVNTGIFDRAEDRAGHDSRKVMDELKLPDLSPNQAATYILKGLEKGKLEIAFPFYAKVFILLYQLFPKMMLKQIVNSQKT